SNITNPLYTALYSHSLHDALPIYGSPIALNKNCKYDLLADSKKVVFLLIGPSNVTPTSVAPAVAVRPNLSSLPSFNLKLKTELKDRKSTRLNSSHVKISYAVFSLK